MKLVAYIWYRVLNAFISKIKTKRTYPLLRLTAVNKIIPSSFYFDLADEHTHLGDRFFFVPLLIALRNYGCIVKLSKNDDVTKHLVQMCSQDFFPLVEQPEEFDQVVITRPSFFKLYRKYQNPLSVDFTDTRAHLKISIQLIESFKEQFKLNLEYPNNKLTLKSQSSSVPKQSILLNNYMNSGGFRKYFIDKNKLLEKCLELKNEGFQIIHVGSKMDKDEDKNYYAFVDQDLRGQLTIEELIQLVSQPNIVAAVTFDNFIMHLMGALDKKAFVLFRGRFSRKHRTHHFRKINNNFYSNETNLLYI